MAVFVDTTPFGERFEAVCKRAKVRSERSAEPQRFLNEFEGEMAALRREGLASVVERGPDWSDPTHLAAEVEALAALRAMRTWGTTVGLCLARRVRNGAA